MKKLIVCFCWLLPLPLAAREMRDQTRLYWVYEVGNQLNLADFGMGSVEKIKDQNGNGVGLSWVLREGGQLNLALDVGQSNTRYQGRVEDGVTVSFQPQTGSGFEALSSSTNVTYDFNLEFNNPYLGLSLIWEHFRIGGGRLFQKAKGTVEVNSQGVQLLTASYVARTQLYYWGGFDFNLENFYIGIYARNFEAPALQIDNCNAQALGELLCQRIVGAAGNRNQRSTLFGEGLLHLGWLF